MPPDRKDFLAHIQKKEEKAAEFKAFQAEALRQATVKAQHLTSDEKWDYFLSLLQARLEEATNQKIEWMEKCSIALADTDVKVAQINFAVWNERARLLDEIMNLPKAIIEEGKKA